MMQQRKLTEAGRKAALQLSSQMLRLARPLFWHPGIRSNGVLKGATAFILQFERGFVGVTAGHVIEAYLADLAADSRTVCQLGECRLWPEKSLIACSSSLDIATFGIDPGLLEVIGADPVDCRGAWPPPQIHVGDGLTLAGFLDKHRNKLGPRHYGMEAWGAHGVVDAVSDRDIVTVYDPKRSLAPDPRVALPPLGLNMSGCSGGPAVLVTHTNGSVWWFPVGLIYKGPGDRAEGEFASFDRIHIRRLHLLRPDGTIHEPDTGWLP